MNRASESYIKFYCSKEQRADAERRAEEAGLSLPNFLRQLLGWELEQHGKRKDLLEKATHNNSMDVRQKQRR